MKKLLALALVALMAGGALAQEINGMGVFFSDTEFTDATTTAASTGAPQNMYVVLIASEFATIGGYECGLSFSDAGVFALGASGPNGWTNFGSGSLDHLCGYMTPLAVGGNGAVVLSTVSFLFGGGTPVDITMGQASIPSFPGFPAIADGSNPEALRACVLTTGVAPPGVVANLNGSQIVATEERSLSEVKALFE